MKQNMAIGRHPVGTDHPPFVIAELSGNHNGSLDRALEIVKAAAQAGAHCLKLQTYTADTMTLDTDQSDFFISDAQSLWKGKSLYQLYQEASTPWEWHQPIFDLCRELGMVGMSSPFDATAVDFLDSLDVPAFKIASFEAVDLPLVKKIAEKGKPVIASTGMATLEEIDLLVQTVRSTGNEQLILLKCTSSYPATATHANLKTIPHLREAFGVPVGLSDHTLGIGVAIAGVAYGACVIEKHLTLNRTEGGVDSDFSLEPAELKSLVEESRRAWEAAGSVQYGASHSEKPSLRFRRSIYACADIKAGDEFTENNTRIIRPGYALAPRFLPVVLGKRAKKDLRRGDRITWEVL